jgi:hypothetical protein
MKFCYACEKDHEKDRKMGIIGAKCPCRCHLYPLLILKRYEQKGIEDFG